MAKYCLKKPSKRIACAKRHKIEKRVREHNKKQRKEAKKKSLNRGKNVKMISVPNKFPMKEEILAQAEKRRAEIKIDKEKKKLVVKANAKLTKQKKARAVKSAQNENETPTNGVPIYFIQEKDLVTAQSDTVTNKNVKAFSAEVRKTIETADVVIEVLDARDPLGSRSRRLEELVISQGKRLVLLLNKIDLVPKENVLKWLAYLRNQMPTIAFKASTQEQNQKLSRYITANLHSNSSKCIGADLVMKLLGNYCRNKDIKTSIRVGIVGFPNVGKSSVINSLKRKKACNTGSVPGLTRQMQEIELDKHIRLIDSPGVVLATKEDEFDATELALRNVLRVDMLPDPQLAVNAILRRCSVKVLMLHYNLPEFNDCESFLALMARRLGKLRKGGRPDINAAAKHVLNDWNCGKLRYHTKPPEHNNLVQSEILSSEIISGFSKEFDIDALQDDIKTLVEAVPESTMAVDAVYDPSVTVSTPQSGDSAEEDETMDDDSKSSRTVVTGGRVAKKRSKILSTLAKSTPVLPDTMDIDSGNTQLNRAINVALKKHKKRQNKLTSRANKLADSLSSKNTLESGDANMDYDFNVLNE